MERTMKTLASRFLFAAALAATALVVTASLLSPSAFAQAPDRSKPPELAPPQAMKLPPIQHFKLSNGIPVVLMEKHELPLVQVELLIRAGSVFDPPAKLGRASLMADLMDEGAGKRNSLELADAIDFLGVALGAFASNHTSGVTLHTPLSKLDSALALFADVALRPTFPPAELERKRKERLTLLLQWHDQPGAINSVAFNSILFGTEHPYGRPNLGTEKSIRSMRVEDLREFYSTYFHAGNATLVVVGDIVPAQMIAKLEQYFGSWKGGEAASANLPQAGQVKERRIYLVDKPGAAQSVIRIGRIGAARMTEDYHALIVLNTILGGSFTSRLNQNLREKHEYTYGAGSAFDFRPSPGAFSASASVQTDVTDKALAEFMKELTNIMEPVTDDELTRAKNYLALGYPGDFSSIAAIAGQLAELVIYQLPDDTFNSYTSKILAVTKDDVSRVAKKYLDPQKVDIVIVGDSKKVRSGIAALSLAPIEDRSIDKVLGKPPVISDK
jgi:predicted Zn-dependent peptidase